MNPLDCKYRVWHISVIVDEVIVIHLITVKSSSKGGLFCFCRKHIVLKGGYYLRLATS